MARAPAPLLTRRDGRPTKFTPERIEQIKNLVERGKSRDEIAELLNVTVGSLQVTCSRLGVSLRRPLFKNGVALRRRSGTGRNGNVPKNGVEISTPAPPPATTTPYRERTESQQADAANFAITIQYKGREKAIKLPLTENIISHLALEAELRDLRIGELISELLVTALKTGTFERFLDGQDAASI